MAPTYKWWASPRATRCFSAALVFAGILGWTRFLTSMVDVSLALYPYSGTPPERQLALMLALSVVLLPALLAAGVTQLAMAAEKNCPSMLAFSWHSVHTKKTYLPIFKGALIGCAVLFAAPLAALDASWAVPLSGAAVVINGLASFAVDRLTRE